MKTTTWKGGVLGATILLLLADAAVSETPRRMNCNHCAPRTPTSSSPKRKPTKSLVLFWDQARRKSKVLLCLDIISMVGSISAL
jgi:hypothetical protein